MKKLAKKYQIYDIDDCKGKTIARIEKEFDISIVIHFTDKTYIKFTSGYNGSHETIEVSVPVEVIQRKDNLKFWGVKCLKCEHLWLPKNILVKPKSCSKCGSRKILGTMDSFDEENA